VFLARKPVALEIAPDLRNQVLAFFSQFHTLEPPLTRLRDLRPVLRFVRLGIVCSTRSFALEYVDSIHTERKKYSI
jgi:hypothetical protein